jgi:hypothetical protein
VHHRDAHADISAVPFRRALSCVSFCCRATLFYMCTITRSCRDLCVSAVLILLHWYCCILYGVPCCTSTITRCCRDLCIVSAVLVTLYSIRCALLYYHTHSLLYLSMCFCCCTGTVVFYTLFLTALAQCSTITRCCRDLCIVSAVLVTFYSIRCSSLYYHTHSLL